MSARQEKNGTWTSQFRYKDLHGNPRHKCKRGFPSEEEALAFEDGFKRMSKGSMCMRFIDFVDVYEADVRPRVRQSTWEAKEFMITNKIIPFFGRMVMRDIRARDIIAWQNELLEGNTRGGKPYSPTYLRTVNNQLVAILNHAERYYDLSPNPAKKVSKIGSKKGGEMQVWTKAEYLAFSKVMEDKPASFYAFEMLYWTGIRLGELLALTPDDFDFIKSTLSITKSYAELKDGGKLTPPKTEKSVRVIAMPEFLRDEMSEYICDIALVPPDERIFQFSKSYLGHEIRRGCAISGVKRIRVHDLRHSHVSLLISMRFSAVAIADRMGHESTDITYRYAHMFPNTQNKMADALQEFREEQ